MAVPRLSLLRPPPPRGEERVVDFGADARSSEDRREALRSSRTARSFLSSASRARSRCSEADVDPGARIATASRRRSPLGSGGRSTAALELGG